MITLYGNYPTLESLTFDLRRMLAAIGWRVVRLFGWWVWE